ncbi:MAG: hypothetical protein PHW18_09030 [Sulfuricurvum sp.]|uniref:hypothetical protein n=1 Tax=Sulfuricurvum sp. TaxID=2025608 RepID=UPI002634CC3E|nr:hypothetical protein [Sulfuricurvum sp.]MDD2829702.1 hypothetical protein [Sulfuricurvum sp.]MDD4950144.1 hypothetical protein [Sulfuricurvum sp.]
MTEEKLNSLLNTAQFFIDASRKLLTENGRLHAETLIISLARIAGSLMYRSFEFDNSITSGTVVLSDQANIHGPKLMNTMFAVLNQMGNEIGENNLNMEYASPKTSQLTFQESHERLSTFFLAYCKTGVSFYDAAISASIAVGITVNDCKEVLSVDKGAAIAIYGFIEGTKTSPY